MRRAYSASLGCQTQSSSGPVSGGRVAKLDLRSLEVRQKAFVARTSEARGGLQGHAAATAQEPHEGTKDPQYVGLDYHRMVLRHGWGI